MSKTIKELADELGVSKSGIRKYMTPSFRSKYTFKNANRILIKDSGIVKVRSEIANSKTHLERTKNTSYSAHTNIESMRYENEIIDQLKQKDQQIKQLQKLLDQSQQLQLMAEKKIKQLENKNDKSETEDLSKEKPESEKKGFWKGLFS